MRAVDVVVVELPVEVLPPLLAHGETTYSLTGVGEEAVQSRAISTPARYSADRDVMLLRLLADEYEEILPE